MRKTAIALVLTLAAIGTVWMATRDDEANAPVMLPEVGRAVRYSLDGEVRTGQPLFDVMEVAAPRVRVRKVLCEEDEPGFWVNWQDVRSWEDTGRAWGDDRWLGLPLHERSPYGLEGPEEDDD